MQEYNDGRMLGECLWIYSIYKQWIPPVVLLTDNTNLEELLRMANMSFYILHSNFKKKPDKDWNVTEVGTILAFP